MKEETLQSAAELEMYERLERKYPNGCMAYEHQAEFERGLNDLLMNARFINAWYRKRGDAAPLKED